MSSGNAAQAAEALRNSFASYLKGQSIEVITLSARLPPLAIEEARQSQCDYILSASMNVKKGGGGSMFGRRIADIAGAAAGRIPSTGSAASGAIKAKDEVTLEYKLDQVETTKTVLASKDKAKASADGEDVISPLVQKAAGDVLATTTQKQ
jgi:outer membrane lipoprotein SlyB